MNWQQRVQKQGAARRRFERVRGMEPRSCSLLRVMGIAPYKIERVEGTYLVEFHPKTGRCLNYGDQYEVPVVAFDVCHPEGKHERYETLREARAEAARLAAERRKGVK